MRGQEPSGIDHIYSNNPHKYSEVQIKVQGASDHRLTSVTRYTKSKFSTRKIVRKRSFKNFNEANYLEALSHTSWWDIYQTENVDEAVGLMTHTLT